MSKKGRRRTAPRGTSVRQPRGVGRPNRSKASHVNTTPDEWVASTLLNAMDRMDQHVQEMLDTPGPQDSAVTAQTAAVASPADTAAIQALIKQELTRIMENKLKDIVDTAIMARLQRLEASRRVDQPSIETLQTTSKRDGQTLHDLDVLHRHEHTLNTALVERLFQASSLEGHPETRLGETTFGLQGTDSVNSVLVSHVEALVMRVQGLEREVNWLQEALKRKGI